MYRYDRSARKVPAEASPSCVPVTRKQVAEPQVAWAGLMAAAIVRARAAETTRAKKDMVSPETAWAAGEAGRRRAGGGGPPGGRRRGSRWSGGWPLAGSPNRPG